MTAVPENAVRLAETTKLLVLDPSAGPVPRAVSALALGDEALVTVEGRMCFRRIMVADEAPPPDDAIILAAGGLSPDLPAHSIVLDSRQKIGLASLPSPVAPISSLPNTKPQLASGYWIDLTIEGADRVIAENISIATGPFAEPTSVLQERPLLRAAAQTPTPPTANHVEVVRAFNGTTELSLLGVVTQGSTSILQFDLPPRTTTLRLSSPSVQPPGDSRRLGIALFRLVVGATDIPLDSPALVRGFHSAESGEGLTWRWTDGEALLILPPRPTAQNLAVHITDWHLLVKDT